MLSKESLPDWMPLCAVRKLRMRTVFEARLDEDASPHRLHLQHKDLVGRAKPPG